MLKRGAGGGPLAALRWLTRRFQGGAAAPAPPANNGKSGNFDQGLLPPSPKQLRRDKDVGCHEDGEIRVDPGHSWSTARRFFLLQWANLVEGRADFLAKTFKPRNTRKEPGKSGIQVLTKKSCRPFAFASLSGISSISWLTSPALFWLRLNSATFFLGLQSGDAAPDGA